jgi:hypothetical protein
LLRQWQPHNPADGPEPAKDPFDNQLKDIHPYDREIFEACKKIKLALARSFNFAKDGEEYVHDIFLAAQSRIFSGEGFDDKVYTTHIVTSHVHTHSPTHSPTHSLTHSLTHPLTHTTTLPGARHYLTPAYLPPLGFSYVVRM